MIDVYLLECHTWSDGEDDHEEDHNYYYDIKYFYVSKSPIGHVIFAWKAMFDDISTGLIMQANDIYEMMSEKHMGNISLEQAKHLVSEELAKMEKRTIKEDICIKAAQNFLLN